MKKISITATGLAGVRQSTRVVGLALVISLGVVVGDSIGSLLHVCSATSVGTCTETCSDIACRNVPGGNTCDASAVANRCVMTGDVGICERWDECPGKCLDNITDCDCATTDNICG